MPAPRLLLATLLLWLTLAAPVLARDVLHQTATLDTPTSRTDAFPLTLDALAPITLHADIHLRQGRLAVTLSDSHGKPLQSFAAQDMTGVAFSETLTPGTYTLTATAENAQGTWSLRAGDQPIPAQTPPTARHFLPGLLMILVALAAALGFRRATRESWRWLACGALLWTVAVAIKFFLAFSLNGPLLGLLQARLPHAAFIALGSTYIGLLTGITEVAITLAAGLRWPRLAATPHRALAIGVGAGAVEALLLGIGTAIAPLALAANRLELPAVTATAILAPSFERVIALVCHTAVHAMTLYAVATRRWRWFWSAFLLFSALDGVAGFYHITGLLATANPWLLELPLFPFALASLPVLRHVTRHWPAHVLTAPSALHRRAQEKPARLAPDR
jgi:hypothetical protein